MMKSLVFKLESTLCRMFGIAVIPYVLPYMGLGNRLKGLANYYARGYRRFWVIWRDDSWVTAPFSTLFTLEDSWFREINASSKFYPLAKKLFSRFLPGGIVAVHKPFWSFILPNTLCDASMRHQWSFTTVESFSVDWWFDRTPRNVIDYFIPFFKHLTPSKKVWERIQDLECDISDCVCVQIRNNDDRKDEKDVCSLEKIFAAMRTFPSDTKFFVSCMTEPVWHSVKAEFADRVWCLKNKNVNSMIDAVADMWLLGHGKSMIASPESTFSEVAWWWGGAKNEVVMLESDYNQRDR